MDRREFFGGAVGMIAAASSAAPLSAAEPVVWPEHAVLRIPARKAGGGEVFYLFLSAILTGYGEYEVTYFAGHKPWTDGEKTPPLKFKFNSPSDLESDSPLQFATNTIAL